jgi:hypothetical protein
LALNLNPPNLCLLSSWDYRHEPPAPSEVVSSLGKGSRWCFMLSSGWACHRVLEPLSAPGKHSTVLSVVPSTVSGTYTQESHWGRGCASVVECLHSTHGFTLQHHTHTHTHNCGSGVGSPPHSHGEMCLRECSLPPFADIGRHIDWMLNHCHPWPSCLVIW